MFSLFKTEKKKAGKTREKQRKKRMKSNQMEISGIEWDHLNANIHTEI